MAAATRTSSRQAAQKAKEAMAAAPGTKSKGGAGTKRKETAQKGPEPKKEKKEEPKPQDEAMKEEPKPTEEKPGDEKKEPEAPAAKEKEEEKGEEKQDEGAPAAAGTAEAAQGNAASPCEKPEPSTEEGPTAGEKPQEREDIVPSNVLEKGIIYFFFRPRVNVSEPHGVSDVARSFFVLRPTSMGAVFSESGPMDEGAKCRLMMLPKKKYPTSPKERDMGFVEKAGVSMKQLQESFMAGETYETETRGERNVPEAKPYAEGVYAITHTKRASHLAYVLTVPAELGQVQEDFGLYSRGSFIVQSKNPKYPGPSFAQLPKEPEYPENVREKFGDYRWIPLEPEFMNYPNAQFLMIGEAQQELGKAAVAEPGDKRPEEIQPGEEAMIRYTRTLDSTQRTIRSCRQPGPSVVHLTILLYHVLVSAVAITRPNNATVVNQTTCGGQNYAYTGLEGYGYLPSDAVDKYGDTLGGIGSSAAIDRASWRRTGPGSYTGIVWCLPDRGWNTNGTLNFQSRVHKLAVNLQLAPNASAQSPSSPNLHLKYLDTILLTGPDGEPTTGLDADGTGHASYAGFPPLPVATYPGDGFGGDGPGGKRISIDAEGLVLDPDGGFWISDEYGPYIYKFNHAGKMVHAIQPPEAILPHRNGSLSFNAASPPIYAPEQTVVPEDTESGRNNNQGLEALTMSVDGKTLYAMLQSALNQEGGPKKKNRQPARVLEYDISSGAPKYKHEYVVMLPKYQDYTDADKDAVASQSEILHLPTGDFLVLARDSGFGHGQSESRSVYRHADIFSISHSTTDLKGKYDGVGDSIASSKGELDSGIVPAEYCSFLDFNVASELAKFGLHNGGEQDASLLNEKWESLALVPVDPSSSKHQEANEYFLFSFSDNDFITQNGRMNFGKFKYADESGYSLDSQVLVFRLQF
ncbi:esterase-like activity of phytase-domain-containing protein [Aspergillus ambiguus]|uniref:esterase-like activity of phytase family protein n=1 Tax=Aspergillus ambiguus TaxID=176160 RepID=UPI003CCCF4A0